MGKTQTSLHQPESGGARRRDLEPAIADRSDVAVDVGVGLFKIYPVVPKQRLAARAPMNFRLSLLVLLLAIVTASNLACAQPYADERRRHPGAHVSARHMRDWYGGTFRPACCVLGPAYGRPGEPLGPAYNLGVWMPDPRVCGPGACQNNPHY